MGCGTYKAMHEPNQHAHKIGPLPHNIERHQRVLSKPLLADNEENRHQTSEYDQTYDFRRVPRESFTAEVEPEQEHDSETNDGKTAKPIDGSYTIVKIRPWIMNI